jgi:hypothetical protein
MEVKKERTLAQLIADYAKTKSKDPIEIKQKRAFFSPYCHGFQKPHGR